MAQLSKNPSQYSDDLAFTSSIIKEAGRYDLEIEVILAALIALKQNSKLTIQQALQEGFNEWVK